MKAIWKALIGLFCVTGVAVSIGSYAYLSSAAIDKGSVILDEGDDMEISNGRFTFKVEKSSLRFTLSSSTRSWDSGSIDESDETITSLREAFLISPVTVYALSPTGGESSFSMWDEGHRESTRVSLYGEGDGLVAKVSMIDGRRASPNLSLSFNLHYALHDDGLSISVDSIQEKEGSNKLSRLVIYPGFGSSYKQNDGYILVPDGSGAIIDLSKPSDAQSALQLTTYGKDFAVNSSKRSYYSAEQLAFPMYGIASENSSLMAMVEGGEEYSELNAKVAGMVDNYNCAYFRFLFRDVVYQYQGLDTFKTVPQEEMNSFAPSIRYQLYDEKLDYGEYAGEYRGYLLGKGLLSNALSADPKLHLDFLMADAKKALFGEELVPVSNAEEVGEMMDELATLGNEFDVSLRGFTAGGLGHSYPYAFPVEGAIGGNNGIRELTSSLHQQGIATHLDVDLLRSVEGKGASGNDLALNVSQKKVTTNDYVNGTSSEFLRVVPSKTASLLQEYEKKAEELGIDGFDFASIGFDLFSTFFHEVNTRSQSKAIYEEAISLFGLKKHMRKPNLYMLRHCDAYLEASIGSSSFLIESESIPFVPMLLSGRMNLYSAPVNLNYLGKKQLLQMVDYGICPSYLLTKAETMELLDCEASSYVHSSEFDLWKEDVKSAYQMVINTLKQVKGALFSSREQIAPSVYRDVYSNGKDIIVNYGTDPYIVGTTEVPSLGSAVVEHE